MRARILYPGPATKARSGSSTRGRIGQRAPSRWSGRKDPARRIWRRSGRGRRGRAVFSGARVISGRGLGEIDVPAALATGALVIEDAAAIGDERALFHLINLAREEE